jgi:MSHA biogenesis protein MshJ
VKAIGTMIAKINRASLRERGLLFLAAVAVLAMVWNHFVMRPLTDRRMAIANSLADAREGRASASSGHDPGLADRFAALKLREAALGAAIAAADAQLRHAQAGMIAPKEMLGVLTEVLGHQKGLTLVLLHNLPVEPLFAPASGQSGAPSPTGMDPYLHPIELILRGDYLNVLAYLEELESRPWGFQWRRFELTTTDGAPEYRIEFTTLSMQSNWLGV